MTKGPFWVLCNSVVKKDTIEITFDDARIVCCKFNIYEITQSHKELWRLNRSFGTKMAWNYYPRGRVEIKRDKVIVFANPVCYEWINIEKELRKAFDIPDGMEMQFKIDNSSHYQCLINEK